MVLPTIPEEEAKKLFPKGFFSPKSSHMTRNTSTTPPAIGSPWSWCWSCPISTVSQRMVGAHHVSPQQSIKNILVWSQPRSLGCYTTGLLNESSSKNPLGSFVPSAAFSSVHISSHSLLTLFEIWDSFWIYAGFMTKRWHQFMLEKACFAPLQCQLKCSFHFLKPEWKKQGRGAVLRWQRNRMGRPLSPPQIHQKNIWTLSKFHKTTSECWQRTSGTQKSSPLSLKGGRTKYKR